ncbi:MAG: HAMP domain-containing sensor histidine kinase [Kiritimatiellae bacterium]|nr:HAMP domain-containing sensor histidine kinase [Kiritimatiellia bacterium]
MFSKRKARRLLSFAMYLATGYVVVYALCTAVMFYMGNRVITLSARNFDKQNVRADCERLTELLETNPSGNWMSEELALERYPPSTIFALRIINTLGYVEYIAITPRETQMPGWGKIGEGPVDFPNLGWEEIILSDTDRIIQMHTTQISDGRILQIAKGSLLEKNQKQMMSRNMTLFMLFSLFLSIFSTLFMIFITLRPINKMTKSIRSIIDTGAFESNPQRVKSMISELDTLGSQFNIMTEKYASLIQAMRETMDNVAHDIRTPLSRIRGASEFALKTETLPEPLANTLVDIIEDCDHAQLQLQNLLDSREMESGFVKINPLPFSLSKIINTVADIYSLIAEEKSITLTTSLPAEEDIQIKGDQNRVARIVSNIVDNALKYTPDSGRVGITLTQNADSVTVQVSDTGIGISADELSLVWQRLYRSEQARKSSKGLGLGMNIVKLFTEAHGGRAEIESSPAGTVVTITLPKNPPA